MRGHKSGRYADLVKLEWPISSHGTRHDSNESPLLCTGEHLMDIEVETEAGLAASGTNELNPFGKVKAQFMQQLEAFMHAKGGRDHLPGVLTDGTTWYLARFKPTGTPRRSSTGSERHEVEWTRVVVRTKMECRTLVKMLIALLVAKVAVAAFLGTMTATCPSHGVCVYGTVAASRPNDAVNSVLSLLFMLSF